MPTRLGYAILFVSDLDRAIGFYRDVIGVPLRVHADAYAEFATEVRSKQRGYAATAHRWVQSYGSRCVRPRSSTAVSPAPHR